VYAFFVQNTQVFVEKNVCYAQGDWISVAPGKKTARTVVRLATGKQFDALCGIKPSGSVILIRPSDGWPDFQLSRFLL